MISRQVRQFSTTASRKDLFDFLRRKSIKPASADLTQKSTKEVMKEAEESNKQVAQSNDAPETKKAEKKDLRVVGLPPAKHDWTTENNGFEMNAWPVRLYNSRLGKKKVSEVLQSQYKNIVEPKLGAQENWVNTSLEDLQLRFEYTKAVMQELQVAIPDHVQSQLETIGDVQSYYLNNVAGVRFNEKEPDALYLKPNEFGPNVTIVDAVEQKRQLKNKWKRVLKEAKTAEAARGEKMMEEAMSG